MFLLTIEPEWANFILAVVIAVVSALVAIIGWTINLFHKKIENLEKLITTLEIDVTEKILEEDKKVLTEVKYNLKESLIDIKDKINNITNHLNNIEGRLADRTNYARAKWDNLHSVIIDIQAYLQRSGNYMPKYRPLKGVDSTLSSDGSDDLPNTTNV
jgi:signal transduction histidine kinase